MGQVQEEAIRAVSAALGDANGDLLSIIDEQHEKWQKELANAKEAARELLASVLSERESLRSSLGTAAELWRTLKPTEPQRSAKIGSSSNLTGTSVFLADKEQVDKVRSLQNVSHTIFFLEFIIAAPGALQRARASMTKLLDDGLDKVVAGNAATLVEAHAILTAVERLRDLILLESPDINYIDSSLSWFTDAAETRSALEDIVIRDIFSNVILVSQQNPRLLVAAGRIIESEEAEDVWWNSHLQGCGLTEQGGAVRPFGAQDYRNRALESVMSSLRSQFFEKERELGLDAIEGVIAGSDAVPEGSPTLEVLNILEWIHERRSENETVRRYVVPCLPPSFSVSSSYEKELHRQFMRLITRLLHLVHPDGSMLLSESDLISLTTWYCQYQEEVGDQQEAIDSFLSDGDRKRLISALQKHCAARVSAKILSAVAADQNPADEVITETQRHDIGSLNLGLSMTQLRRSDIPDVVLGCVNEQVRRMLALKIKGMDQAIAETAADCLLAFQKEIRHAMSVKAAESSEERYRLYACATANNMARCLEYSEDIRDLFIPLASDSGRSDIEERMERVIEGFRSCASAALRVLIDGMDANLKVHVTRLYAPHTGTEIMLDIIATLEDYFSDYQMYLLPYHFEHLVIESLKRVVVWYIAPFLRMAQDRVEASAARRFTSLPTFDKITSMTVDIPPEHSESDLLGRPAPGTLSDATGTQGLRSLNGAAVVAQIDKDRANLSEFMAKKVVLYQKKQVQPTLEPLQAIRSLYTCPSTTFGLSDSFREARAVIGRALRPPWVSACGLSGHVSFRVAEMIWESRKDVNPVVLLEAVSLIRSLGDKPERSTPKDSRMSSFDDGRFWGSRHRDSVGPFSERLLGTDLSYEQATSSSSLLWAPSASRSSRSRRR